MQTSAALDSSLAPAPQPAPSRRRAELQPYGNEKTLFAIMALISGAAWLALTLATVGLIWVFMLLLYLLGLVAMSYFISYVRGNGVQVTAHQFPDLHARFQACCATLGMDRQPDFYLLTGNGALNAFATRFLHRNYVVLYSDIVDALEDDPEALNFYIGHELGHIAQKHLIHHWWLVFARWIPLLGAAYSRAREYTCDQYGLLCTDKPDSAVRALSVLAAGSRRWKTMNTHAYIAQTSQTRGFWMSLNELTADYPWLCKRVTRVAGVVGAKDQPQATFPRRSVWAWLVAALIPNTGFGLIGAMVVYAYLMFAMIPVGLAAYNAYATRAKEAAAATQHAPTRAQISQAHAVGMTAAKLVNQYLKDKRELPSSLDELQFKLADTAAVRSLRFDSGEAEILLQLSPPLNNQTMTLGLSLDDQGQPVWACTVSGALPKAALPAECSSDAASTQPDDAPAKAADSPLWKFLMKVL